LIVAFLKKQKGHMQLKKHKLINIT